MAEGLKTRTSWQVWGGGTGHTGLWRRTGGLVRGTRTGGPGLVTHTSGRVRGAGIGRTGLWRRTGGLVLGTGTGGTGLAEFPF